MAGKVITVSKAQQNNSVIITPNGSDTIAGFSTYYLKNQWSFVTLVSNGLDPAIWHLVGGNLVSDPIWTNYVLPITAGGSGAATQIPNDFAPFVVINSDASYTLTANPTIDTTNVVLGQHIKIQPLITEGWAITLVDNGTDSGSLLRLTATSVTLQPGEIMELMWDGNFWVQTHEVTSLV